MMWSQAVRLAAAIAVAGCGTFLPAAASAAPPARDRFPVEAEFDFEPATQACGFPVTIAFSGTFDLRVFTRPDGSVHEIDTQPATKLTYRSATGSYAVPFSAVYHATYPDGAFAGAPAHITLTGKGFGSDPFVGPGSGRLVFEGVIAAMDGDIPLTRFTELVSASGEFTKAGERLCAALGG
jgi:hypothetical protein